jgi:hypothetical protein
MAKRNYCRKNLKKQIYIYSSDTRNKKEIKGFARVGKLYFIVQW